MPKVPTTTSVIPTYDLSGGLLQIVNTFVANKVSLQRVVQLSPFSKYALY